MRATQSTSGGDRTPSVLHRVVGSRGGECLPTWLPLGSLPILAHGTEYQAPVVGSARPTGLDVTRADRKEGPSEFLDRPTDGVNDAHPLDGLGLNPGSE